MDKQRLKNIRRNRRRRGIRKRVVGTPSRPRLAIFRSLKHMYVQIIDDMAGKTLCSASTREGDIGDASPGNAKAAQAVGDRIASRAKEQGIKTVAFDRGGFRYHGRVKALAEAARKGGLEF